MSTLTLKELDIMELLVKEVDSLTNPDDQNLSLKRLEHRLFLHVAPLLSLARRQLEQEDLGKREAPSSTCHTEMRQEADVLPLGEVKRNSFNGCEGIDFEDRFGSRGRLNGDKTGILIQQMGLMTPHFSREHVRSLIAHLQSWLLTGSFELGNQPVQSDFKPFRWVCEFCFETCNESTLPASWDFIWQSAVCPKCRERVQKDGGYPKVVGGAYSEWKEDPRASSLSADLQTDGNGGAS